VSQVHLAFQAPDRATVHKFHAVALAAGGRDNMAAHRSLNPAAWPAPVSVVR